MTENGYRPTTEYVRNAYVDHQYNMAAYQGEYPPVITERIAAFNRWLGSIEAAAEQRGAQRALRDAAAMVRDKDHRDDLRPDPHSVGWGHALDEVEHLLIYRADRIADQMEGNA